MDYALRVQNGGNCAIFRTEQVVRLYHLEPLVEHGSAVDCNLRAHIPRGVAERHFGRDRPELFGGKVPERAAARRYEQPFERGGEIEAEALPDCRVFAVYGAYIAAPLFYERHNEVAAAHERLLVGERENLARVYRRERVFEPRKPARRHEDDVSLFVRSGGKRRFLTRIKARARGNFGNFFCRVCVGKRRIRRAQGAELLIEKPVRAIRRERHYFEFIGIV